MLWRISADTQQARIGIMFSSAQSVAQAFSEGLHTVTGVSVTSVFPQPLGGLDLDQPLTRLPGLSCLKSGKGLVMETRRQKAERASPSAVRLASSPVRRRQRPP